MAAEEQIVENKPDLEETPDITSGESPTIDETPAEPPTEGPEAQDEPALRRERQTRYLRCRRKRRWQLETR